MFYTKIASFGVTCSTNTFWFCLDVNQINVYVLQCDFFGSDQSIVIPDILALVT